MGGLTVGVARWWVGREQRRFAGTNLKPHKLLENAHAALRQSHHHGPGVLGQGSGARCVGPPEVYRISAPLC
jgi:hypothetical protein